MGGRLRPRFTIGSVGTLFLSYAAADRARARDLADGLDRAGHTVRMDDRLVGDAGWWSGVLADIQGADAFLFARSASSLASPACIAERDYAAGLGLPVLSVLLDRAPAESNDTTGTARAGTGFRVTGDGAAVDFGPADAAAAFRLVGAMAALPLRVFGTRWQPPPAPPFERLADLARDVGSMVIGRDDQLRLAARLREAADRADAADAAQELAAIFRARTDLSPTTIDRLNTLFPRDPATPGQPTAGPATAGQPTASPAAPGQPTATPVTPWQPAATPATPGQPTATPVTPWQPAAGPATPGQPTATPVTPWEPAAGPPEPVPPIAAPADPGPPTGTLTEQAVRDVAFGKPAFNRRGYDEQSVDEFLDLVEADLQTRRAACAVAEPRGAEVVVNLTPADVKAVAFVRPPFGRRGYDERDVDLFLDEVERSFVVLDAELNRRGSPVARRWPPRPLGG
jgi:DivIVA domain-containing protein